MFRGVTNLTLDEKGRFAMPARHRDEILASCEGKMVITVDSDGCLLMYPEAVWVDIEKKLMALPNMNPKIRRMQREIVGHATFCEMNKHGRVSIAASLRKYAALDRQLTIVGQGNKFELWDTDAWDATTQEWANDDMADWAELADGALRDFSL